MPRTLLVYVNNIGQSFVIVKETGLRVNCVNCLHYTRTHYSPMAGQDVGNCAINIRSEVAERSTCTAHEEQNVPHDD